MAKPHTNWMKATVWTPTMKMDMTGSPSSVIESAFHALAGRPKRRAELLNTLKEIAEDLAQYEIDNPSCILEK